MWDFLLRSGYIPFGKGPDIDYDRICFGLISRKKGSECRIVKIDHEEVLCNERIKIVPYAQVRPSLGETQLAEADLQNAVAVYRDSFRSFLNVPDKMIPDSDYVTGSTLLVDGGYLAV